MLGCKAKIENDEYRKKSSFFSNPVGLKVVLTLSPTKSEGYAMSKVNDY
jgi:hypothetical protein